MTERAKLVIVGGPNGAGKTTLALRLVEDWKLAYLGADAVAAELGLGSEGADAVRAGREFLERVRVAVEQRTSILVETTLSGLGTSRLIDQARGAGYSITVVFVFVDSARVSELRIEDRVRKGGHHVSARDVERRFPRSLSNFWHVYREKAALREAVEIDTAMARAVHEEQERNRRLGLRNVYVRSGRIVEELPDGTIRDLGPAEPALTADKARSA